MRNLKTFLLAVVLMCSAHPAATAHAQLVKSFPIANAKLTKTPKYVQLQFGEALTTLKSKSANSIVILDSKSRKVSTSKIVVKKGVARVEISGPLVSGKFMIKYRVVSADGHVLSDDYQFNLKFRG